MGSTIPISRTMGRGAPVSLAPLSITKILAVGTNNHIYKYSGIVWSDNFDASAFLPDTVRVYISNGLAFAASESDNGITRFIYSQDSGDTWASKAFAPAGITAPVLYDVYADPVVAGRVWATCRGTLVNNRTLAILYSDDLGTTWTTAYSETVVSAIANWFPSNLSISANGQTIYTCAKRPSDGSRRIYRSSDAGVTWSAVDFSSGVEAPGGIPLIYVVIDRNNESRVLLTSDYWSDGPVADGIVRESVDAGITWTTLQTGVITESLPVSNINGAIAIVHFGGVTDGYVMRSKGVGDRFIDKSNLGGNLAQDAWYYILSSSISSDERIFALAFTAGGGGNAGDIYQSSDDGVTYSLLNSSGLNLISIAII